MTDDMPRITAALLAAALTVSWPAHAFAGA